MGAIAPGETGGIDGGAEEEEETHSCLVVAYVSHVIIRKISFADSL